jgi:hypothetical protein
MIRLSSYSFAKFRADIEAKAPDDREVRAIYGALTPLQSLTRTKAGLAPENYTGADARHIIRQPLHEIRINDSDDLKQWFINSRAERPLTVLCVLRSIGRTQSYPRDALSWLPSTTEKAPEAEEAPQQDKT